MKVVVKAESGFHITVPVPYQVLRSKLVCRALISRSNMADAEAEAAVMFLSRAAKELGKYTRKSGHFELVDVQSAGGDSVKVIV